MNYLLSYKEFIDEGLISHIIYDQTKRKMKRMIGNEIGAKIGQAVYHDKTPIIEPNKKAKKIAKKLYGDFADLK